MTRAIAETAPVASDRPDSPFGWVGDRSNAPTEAGSVLLHAPSHALQAPGGGEVQLCRTARALDDLGVRVRPFNPWVNRLGGARLLHLFGMSREGLELARVARSKGVPVALSPICWFEPAALRALAPSRLGACRALGAWAIRRGFPRLPGWRRELLGLADAVLPNSEAEASQLNRLFGIDPGRVRVVPNGVMPCGRTADPDPFRRHYGGSDFVLYAGRIEPRKNVQGLVRACRDLGLPLVAIGDAVPGSESYAERCRREGGSGVHWIDRLEPDDPILASAFAASRVFAMPSWFETPGLSALEAALAGAAVVITPFGCTREYFGALAHYARPDRPDQIVEAIGRAWAEGRGATELAELVERRYLWSIVARTTAEVYDAIAP